MATVEDVTMICCVLVVQDTVGFAALNLGLASSGRPTTMDGTMNADGPPVRHTRAYRAGPEGDSLVGSIVLLLLGNQFELIRHAA